MYPEQLTSFLKLCYVSGLGRVALQRLAQRFNHDFNHIFDVSEDELRIVGLNKKQIDQIRSPNTVRLDQDLTWVEQADNHIIPYYDKRYPRLLSETADFPPLLYASGNIDLLNNPQIAIVGSRNCSTSAARTAFEFATYLSNVGLTITSGMATGIDAQAHLGALAASGHTVAVTGTGLDRIYPSKNQQLAYDIHAKGLLVSEFALGTEPRRENFPRRNRIISGLSIATLVIEAGHRSGSLITAHQATEQGREVFAIPGSIHNPQVRGCHQLIRDGAHLVEKAADIVEELASLLGFMAESAPELQQQTRSVELDLESQKLLHVIGFDPVTVDELVERSGLTVDSLSSMLVLLELNDFIQSAPGGCYVRI